MAIKRQLDQSKINVKPPSGMDGPVFTDVYIYVAKAMEEQRKKALENISAYIDIDEDDEESMIRLYRGLGVIDASYGNPCNEIELDRMDNESLQVANCKSQESPVQERCYHPEIKDYYGTHSIRQFRYCVKCDEKFKD